MDIFFSLGQGLYTACQPANLLALVAGLSIGLLTGTIPGISAANGIALMVPVVHAFSLPPHTALILYAGIYYGSKYGGRLGAILLDTAGDASSLATRLDGYPLARSGRAGLALGTTALSSFFGGLVAVLCLTLLGSTFAGIGDGFGPAEYVALISFVFGLILIMSATPVIKTLMSLCLGLILSTVGLDWATGVLRFTFNVPELFDGIDFMIVIIGVFALSEAFVLMERSSSPSLPLPVTDSAVPRLAEAWRYRWAYVRSTVIGFLIGILPGTGSYVANLAAYRFEKLCSGRKGRFGAGDLRGVIAPEAANSASAFGSFIPLLALGIPGSATTAVLLGALLLMNVSPSPAYYKSQPDLVWALIGSMYLGNLLLFAGAVRLGRFLPKLLSIPQWILMPLIIVVSFVSVYAVQQSMISLFLVLLVGLLAYGLRKFGYPLAPLVLGYVLGKPVEDHFRIALAISGGSYDIFLQSPMSQLLWGVLVASIAFRLALFVLKPAG